MPGLRTCGEITLKTAMFKNAKTLLDWILGTGNDIKPAEVTICFPDKDSNPVKRWELAKAMVVKYSVNSSDRFGLCLCD